MPSVRGPSTETSAVFTVLATRGMPQRAAVSAKAPSAPGHISPVRPMGAIPNGSE